MKRFIHVSAGVEMGMCDFHFHVMDSQGAVLAELTPKSATACVELPAAGLCIVDVNDPGAYKSPE